MLQKDPDRYLRNYDIEGSSPKCSPMPKKFSGIHKVKNEMICDQARENLEFRVKRRKIEMGGHNAIKRPYLRTLNVD